MSSGCIFCDIVAGNAPAAVLRSWHDALAIVPLNPVVEGHTLIIPKLHVKDFTSEPFISGRTMQAAAEFARDTGGSCNIITSKGRAATQSVYHLHLHVVPRTKDDGLALPWYSGKGGHGEH